jgi:hypothetical protein
MSSFIPRALLDQYPAETQDPTYRASMLPIATYPNASGAGEHLGLAMPGMIQEPMNALSRLIGSPSSPGTLWNGPNSGSNAEDMRTLLESFLGGNATRGMGAVERGAVEAAPKASAVSTGPTFWDGIESLFSGRKIDDVVADRLLQERLKNEDYSSPIPERSVPRSFNSTFSHDGNDYVAKGSIFDGTANVDWIGSPSGNVSQDYINSLGRTPLRAWRDQFLAENPDVSSFSGYRTTGSRAASSATDENRVQTVPALFSDQLPSLPGAVIAGAEKNAPGFDVWHGSPHDFDKFDISKIGTGEGAQVYGHGLYFAENPSVAKDYQKTLSSKALVNNRPLDLQNPEHAAAAFLSDYGSADAAARVVSSSNELSPEFKAAVLNHITDPNSLRLGYLYQARVNADPAHFFDWDRPLEEQSPFIQNAIEKKAAGSELLARDMAVVPTGVQHLRDAGIQGIRYADAGSRGVDWARRQAEENIPAFETKLLDPNISPGLADYIQKNLVKFREDMTAKPTNNYVLFSDDPVNVLHKWRGNQQLYSDQRPSLWGSALAGDQNHPNALFGF